MIERMRFYAQALISALENNQTPTICLNEFVSSVRDAWIKFEQGQITVEISQLPRAMYMFVVEELPQVVENPLEKEKIIRELKLFLNTIDLILQPKETN
ncbi:MAG: hypothetical protein K9W46_11960 [Candidatus Heimdallarchaeum endolithica]|uniref:Uncharacterized protein n=1 Tax=Candidatus Heimdallarchaeum endolithica TaxID=2876572 RepID=A0A9Y1FNF4_9ARCH|nr:MAG: hypothetical protein K9W46_11960 [Candidatus Heimdallarchaeum endolithica]